MTEILNIPKVTRRLRQTPLYKSGGRYGRLMLTGKSYTTIERGKSRKYIEVICDCGKIKWVYLYSLTSGRSTSCGCAAIELIVKRSTKHGFAPRKRPHSIYRLWNYIKDRCENENCPAYPDYGGRGIYVCVEWHDFQIFYNWCIKNGWQKGLEIDRKDNNGHYEPNNCHFTTSAVQSRNRRSNVIIEAFGEKRCAIDWFNDSICTCSLQTLLNRIKAGINPEKAISTIPHHKIN